MGDQAERRLTTCPSCGSKHDACSAIGYDEPQVPDPGNISLCIDCGDLSVFDDNLELRLPTVEEMKKFLQVDAIVKAMFLVKMFHHGSLP